MYLQAEDELPSLLKDELAGLKVHLPLCRAENQLVPDCYSR